MDKFFLHQIKHNKNSNTFDKGIVVKDTLDEARQSYHAYLGAYAFGHDTGIDYVATLITDSDGNCWGKEVWQESETPNPEQVDL